MAVTINLTLLKRRKKQNGEIPIYIRFTEDRKSKYRSTGESVKAKHWLTKDQKVSSSLRRSTHINRKIQRRKREALNVRDDLAYEGKLSLQRLLNELSTDTNTEALLSQAKAYRKHLDDEGRYWEHRHFKVVIGNLESFITDRDKADQISDISGEWIEDFQDYLLKVVGNSNNTARKKLQRLKGLTDWLLKQKQIETNPYAMVERVAKERTNSKVKLTYRQVQAIERLSLERGSRLWHVRNYFMYSFYDAGIRFGDLCCMKWQNIVDGRLVYNMNKTGKPKSIKQKAPMYRLLFQYVEVGKYVQLTQWQPADSFYVRPPVDVDAFMQPIVKRYASDNKEAYIFGILDKQYSDGRDLRRRISSKNVQVNKRLKVLADKAGIQASVSFHVSRHSFAQYALKNGMDLYAISKALGHSELKVTEEYIKSFEEELLDNAMDELF